ESWDGLTASNAGVYPQIVGSIIIVGFMAVLAFPVGIGAAIYLEEYAPNSGFRGRLATLLEVNISNLAGVPSVVYGLLGLALFRRTLGFGTGIVVSASGTLGLLILPIVIVSTQEALRSVPDDLRQGSYGMGASRWQTLREVVLPEAIPGTLTGTILALARAIGETAPLVIIAVATTTYSPPSGLFSSATALPLQIFAASANAKPEFRHGVVPAAAVVLLTLMLLMNATAIVIRNKYGRET
ncbi:phosphate ABC transporter permease PstA, partial [Halorubrum sp. SS7]